MTMRSYQIADEPTPSTLARFVVNPVLPLLAAMLGGVWIAWPWFALNAVAVGSPTRRAELAWLGLGLVAIAVLAVLLFAAVGSGTLPAGATSYALLAVVVVKLAIVYAVYLMQSRTIEIYEYYGGALNNGVWVLVAAFVLRGRVLGELPALAQVVLG